MNNNNIIIIGAGISGLNTAYQLLKIKPTLKILILEQNNYIGGRIFSFSKKINNHNFVFQAGPSRLNSNHKLFLKLIDELNLKKNLIKIKSELLFKPTSDYKGLIDKSPFTYINKVISYSKNDTKDNLQKYVFIKYAEKILNKDEIEFIKNSFGFYAQLIKMNAYNAIKLCNEGMNPNLQFYTLTPGLHIIIEELHKKLIQIGVTIKLNTSVLNIEYDIMFKIITQTKTYISQICVCAIQKPDLLKFNILKEVKPILNTIGNKSLCRIYSIFKKSDIWFNDINKTTTNSNIRMIIPLDKENGSVMISYSDSKFADKWYKLYNEDKDKFMDTIKNNIFKIY